MAARPTRPAIGAGLPLPRPPWRGQLGLIRRMMVDPRPVLDELRADHGPVVGLGAGPMRLAVVGDPPAIHQLFTMGIDAFRWGHRFNVLGFVVGRTSLIVSDGPDWKRRRAALRSGFSRRRLNGWVDEIVRLTDRRIEAILARLGDSTATLDLYHEGRELVQEIVVRTMFGDALAQRAPEIAALFQRAQEYLEAPSYRQLPHPFRLGRRARVRSDLDALRSIVDQRIAQVRAHPDDDPST